MPTETKPKRSSRDAPKRYGKRPVTTERDLRVYEHLIATKYGCTDDMRALIGVELNTFQNRLSQLTAWDFLQRLPAQQRNKFRLKTPCIHNLGPEAKDLLRERGYQYEDPRASNSFPHDVLASRVFASMKIGGVRCNAEFEELGYIDFEKVSYKYRGQLKDKNVEADTIGFRINNFELRGIEADANTEPRRRLRSDGTNLEEKILADLAIEEQELYKTKGMANCYTAYVFARLQRMQDFMADISRITNGYGSRYILCGHFPRFDDDVPWPKADGHMFTQDWLRVGGKPFNFSKA